jgi:2-dehydropantoate 2-reductase
MLRDIERGAPTEGEHILGDMLARATRAGVETPVLEIALTHVRAYEIARPEGK